MVSFLYRPLFSEEMKQFIFKIGGKEDGESENIWVSKERGNTSITALLVALEDDHMAGSRNRAYPAYIQC